MNSVYLIAAVCVLFSQCNFIEAAGGSGYAGVMFYGPTSTSNSGVFGSPGHTMCYNVSFNNDLRPLVCCKARGYTNSKEKWYGIGCGYSSIKGCVSWGNVLSTPAVKCKGIPTGTLYGWSH